MAIKSRKSRVPRWNPKKFQKGLEDSSFLKFSTRETARKALSGAKQELLQDFQNDPITIEIDAGENAENTSGTLGGYGNLFSFIGFPKGENPTSRVKEAIRKIRLKNSVSKASTVSSKVKFNWQIDVSPINSLPTETPMPWETGRSWLLAIERGISGFGYYLSQKFNMASSRSGAGVQLKSKVRDASFRRVPYFSRMYNNFLDKLSGKS